MLIVHTGGGEGRSEGKGREMLKISTEGGSAIGLQGVGRGIFTQEWAQGSGRL